MLIGKDKIREIVERTDIVQVIGRNVELKRAGRSFRGLCPFHGEKTPSFYVNPERRSYKCFGCQKGGDVIRFLMEFEGKDFVEAMKALATISGVPLSFDSEEEDRLKQRRELLRACQVAQGYFEELLWQPAGAPGREHLETRGVSEATARLVGLGYTTLGWEGLKHRLAAENVPVEAAEDAGLLGNKNGRHYDVFRGRLTVPIRDPDGRVVAFGARVVEGDDERKYINTRETSIYAKGRLLYGLDLARDAIRRAGEVTLVEGYFDAIALREAGVQEVVALCSTALTPEHLGLLGRLEVKRVKLLLDGDSAGRKGALRLAGPLLAGGFSAKVVALPDGQDPDTFLRAHRREGYDELARSATSLSSFVIAAALEGRGLTFEDRMLAVRELGPVIAALPEGAGSAAFAEETATALRLPLPDVLRTFSASRAASRRAEPAPQPQEPRPAAAPRSRGRTPPPERAELGLAALLLSLTDQRAKFGEEATARVSHPGLRELLSGLAAGVATEEELLARLEPELQAALRAQVRAALSDYRPLALTPERRILDALSRVDELRLKEELVAAIRERDDIGDQLALSKDEAQRAELASLQDELANRVTALQRGLLKSGKKGPT